MENRGNDFNQLEQTIEDRVKWATQNANRCYERENMQDQVWKCGGKSLKQEPLVVIRVRFAIGSESDNSWTTHAQNLKLVLELVLVLQSEGR